MGFRRSDLQEAFFVPGTHPFRVWGYGTTDPLGEVLSSDYFRAAGGLMQPGDLIYVSTRPRRERPGAPETGEVRMALVMVRAAERGGATVRLVQDFGGPDDPDVGAPAAWPAALPALSHGPLAAAPAVTAAPQAARRGRGRPPGSRSRRRAPIPAGDASSSGSGGARGRPWEVRGRT